MKKTRLFAAAAAMGMFASVVSAAEITGPTTGLPTTATEKSVASMTITVTGEKIVKAELGGAIVLPAWDAAGVVTTRTTAKAGMTASQIEALGTCYVGWTSVEGTDKNHDGFVDTPIYTWNALNEAEKAGWFYDAGKTWATGGEAATWQYYMGLYSGAGMGGRVLVPGAAKVDGYHLVDGHKNFASDDEAIAYFVEKGVLVEVAEAGKVVGYRTAGEFDYVDSKTEKVVDTESFVRLTINEMATNYKTLADVKAAWLAFMSGTEVEGLNTSGGKGFTAVEVDYNTTGATATSGDLVTPVTAVKAPYVLHSNANIVEWTTNASGSSTGSTTYTIDNDDVAATGVVVVVDAEGNVTDVLAMSSKIAAQAATDNLAKEMADYFAKGYITVVEKTSRYGIKELDSFKPESLKNEAVYTMEWVAKSGEFVKTPYEDPSDVYVLDLTDTDDYVATAVQAAFGGLYKVTTAANDTDKYVLDVSVGNYDFEITDLDDYTANKTKMTWTYDYKDAAGKDAQLSGSLVKLGNQYLPAFNTEAEVLAFMKVASGFGVANGGAAFTGSWAARASLINDHGKTSRSWLGAKDSTTWTPSNGLQSWSATECTYLVKKGDAMDASKIVKTTNAAEIDTNEYGIHYVTLTATSEEATATEKVAVVIAPKYERTYKNGKVVELKAKHLNGNLYAHYTYDWANRTGKVTFYELDGETVQSQNTFKF